MTINTYLMGNNSNQYKEAIENLKDNYKKISESINELRTGWQGGRADKFYNAVENTYLPELSKAIKSLNEYYTFLSNLSNCYSTFDNSYASKNIEV